MKLLCFQLFGPCLIVGLLLVAEQSQAGNEGTLDVDEKSEQFRLPSNYCTVTRDDREVGEFLWMMASQNVPADGKLLVVSLECDRYDSVQSGDLGSAVNLNGFRLAAMLALDGSPCGTCEDFITGLREEFDLGMFPGGEASFLGSDVYGADIKIKIAHGAIELVNIGGLTIVNGVVVDVELITFNQGPSTRNRLLSDAEATM